MYVSSIDPNEKRKLNVTTFSIISLSNFRFFHSFRFILAIVFPDDPSFPRHMNVNTCDIVEQGAVVPFPVSKPRSGFKSGSRDLGGLELIKSEISRF